MVAERASEGPQGHRTRNMAAYRRRPASPHRLLCWRRSKSEEFLAAYIAEKYSPERRLKDIEAIDVADVLSVYDEDCRERQANKSKFDERLARLVKWWGGKMLST